MSHAADARRVVPAAHHGVAVRHWVLLVSWHARLRGLLGHPPPPPGTAWCLPGCQVVHTFGMAFPIDLVWLDRRCRILRVRSGVPPGRVAGHWRAAEVLELASGAVAALGWQVGDVVVRDGHHAWR